MPTSIQTSKFGTLDTSGRVPIYADYIVPSSTNLKESWGFVFPINGVEYRFLPEDRIAKGIVSGGTGYVAPGFLNPDIVTNLKNNSDYLDLDGTVFGTFDIGNFLKNNLGTSTKGYLAPISAFQPAMDQGLLPYQVSTTGPIQGIAQVEGKPVFYGFDGTIDPTGNINYRQAVGQEIIGYTVSDGGGLLAGLGRELNKISPAIGYVSLAYLTAVTGGALGSALMSSGAMTSAAAASAAATAAGATAVGAAAAGAAATAAATAVGTAVASVTAQVAMGVPVETAVKNATVNAVVQTQMPGITAQIQQAVDSPAVASALANASTSYAATVAKGGTADAASKAALAGAAGSITQNLTGSKSAADAMKVIASGGSTDKAAEAAALAFFNEQVAADSAKKRQEAAAAAEDSAQKAAIDEQNRLDAEAKTKADAEASARQTAIDEQNRLDAEVKAAADAKAQADAKYKAEIDAKINEQTPTNQAEIDRIAQETKDAEEQKKRVDDFTKGLTNDGKQNLDLVDTKTDFYDKDTTTNTAYKHDEKSGNYTYTSDDGSTLTLDKDGNIVGHTESTDTSWKSISDPKTGNITLPKLPSGIIPKANVNTINPPTGLPGLTPLMTAGMFGALTQNKGPVYNPAPVQAPNVTLDWNAQPVQAPENGIAYGQQFLNPTYSTGAAGGGLMSLAAGGMTGKFTTLGSYSDGGRLLRGPGDGMSDNIPATIANRQPARLADGEFVVPADVVSHLGNGSTDAGAKVLYAMMDRVRKARTGKAKQGKKIQPQKFVPI